MDPKFRAAVDAGRPAVTGTFEERLDHYFGKRRGGFGATAAVNSTAVCLVCGAVVYLLGQHVAFHERVGQEPERIGP